VRAAARNRSRKRYTAGAALVFQASGQRGEASAVPADERSRRVLS
jgi:hypothetical protein